MTFDLRGNELTDNAINLAHERWYAKQPTTFCRRCDRAFLNVRGGLQEYCCLECELGWYPNGPVKKVESKRPRQYKKKHLPIGSFRSNWS